MSCTPAGICRPFEILSEFLDDRQRIRNHAAWAALTCRKTPAYDALETVLKGQEIPLPTGITFQDKDGKTRRHVRTRWWKKHPITYRDLALAPADVIAQIPHEPAPEDILPGYAGDKPAFVGHYWLTERHVRCPRRSPAWTTASPLAASSAPTAGTGSTTWWTRTSAGSTATAAKRKWTSNIEQQFKRASKSTGARRAALFRKRDEGFAAPRLRTWIARRRPD